MSESARQGPRHAVVIGRSAVAAAVAEALRGEGTEVVAVPDTAALGAGDPGDAVDLVVFAPFTPGSVEARPVVDLSPAEWDRLAEEPVRDGLAAF
ncbi:MAG: hypothetical protein HOU01_10100, partial [Streptomycetaceae bacterium]|nr:hypothetical protein [Streptomycetaceae bacterium]